MRLAMKALLLLAFLAFGQTAAHAHEPPLIRACSADYLRYCQGVPVGEGRVLRCLAYNLDRLAPVCRRAFVLAVPPLVRRRVAQKACRIDYIRYCWGVPAGGGRVLRCLDHNRDRLLVPCLRVVNAAFPPPY